MKTIKILALAAMSITVFGCATASKPENMVVAPSAAAKPTTLHCSNLFWWPQSLAAKTNPAWTSQVDDTSFKSALEASLKARKLLAEGPGKYTLTVKLLELKQPLMGIDMTVSSKAQYTLKEAAKDKVIYDKTVDVSYTAKMSDSMVGMTRLRLANEGSIKANMAQFLDELAALKLSGVSLTGY